MGSSDNEDNLIVPDAGINALEDPEDNEEIVQSLQNRQIQIKVVYRSEDKPEKDKASTANKSTPTSAKATKRFIMSNSKVKLPEEFKKSLKFMGKDSRGYNKYVAPMKTLQKSPEILKSLSLSRTLPSPMDKREKPAIKTTKASVSADRPNTSKLTNIVNETPSKLISSSNKNITKPKTSTHRDTEDILKSLNPSKTLKPVVDKAEKSPKQFDASKFAKIMCVTPSNVTVNNPNNTSLIKIPATKEEAPPPLSSLLNSLKSSGTQISIIKTNEKNSNEKCKKSNKSPNKSKMKKVKVMLRRLRMPSKVVRPPKKNEMENNKVCVAKKKALPSSFKETSNLQYRMKNIKPMPIPVALPSTSSAKSRQALPTLSVGTESLLLNNRVQIKILPNDAKNIQHGNRPTTITRKDINAVSKVTIKEITTTQTKVNDDEMPKKNLRCAQVQTERGFRHICGLVDSRSFFINCFYCSAFFSFEKWPEFITHVRIKHQNVDGNAADNEEGSHTDHTYYAPNDEDETIKVLDTTEEQEKVIVNDPASNKMQNENEDGDGDGDDNDSGGGEGDQDEVNDGNDENGWQQVNEEEEEMTVIANELSNDSLSNCTNISLQVQILKPEESKEQESQQQRQHNEIIDVQDDDKDSLDSLLQTLNSTQDEDFNQNEESNGLYRKARSASDCHSPFTEINDQDDEDDVAPLSDDDYVDNNNKTNNNNNNKRKRAHENDNGSDDGLSQEILQIYEISDEDISQDSSNKAKSHKSQNEKVCETSDDEMPSNDENEDEEPKPTAGCGILFGLTNRAVCEEFLKNLALFPILYSSEVECTRNTYDVYIMKMCAYLNRRFILGITDLEMRHSIQRVNDWYARTMYKMRQHEKNFPNEPFVHRFPHYFEMCKVFLPKNHLPHKLVDGQGAQFKRHNQRRVYPPWVKTRAEDIGKATNMVDAEDSEKVLGLPEVTLDDVRQFLIKKNKIKVETSEGPAPDSWHEIRDKAIKAQKNKSWERIKPAEHGDFKCEICGREYTLWKKFRAHKYTHQPPKFKCEICGKMFTRNYFRQKHIEAVHRASKPPRQPRAPQSENNIPLGDRPEFKCDQCDKVYCKMSSLKEHKQRHAPPRFQCQKCKKMFYTSSSLINHEQSSRCHEQPYICEYCGKAIYSRSTFRIHKKTKHLNIRQWYTCVVCNHKSQSKRYLLHHQQRHHVALEGTLEQLARTTNPQGMRLVHFSEEYRKGYLWRNSLRRPGIKVFSCLTCHVTFERYKDVLHHNKEKHPIRHGTYECQMCPPPGKLLMRSSLRRHYTVIHKVPIEELEMVLSRTKPVLPPSNADANAANNEIGNSSDLDNQTTETTYLEVEKEEQIEEDSEQDHAEYYRADDDDDDDEDEKNVVMEDGEEFFDTQYMLSIDEHDREVKEAVNYVTNCMIEETKVEEVVEEELGDEQSVYLVDNFDDLVEEVIESNDEEEEDHKPQIYFHE